MRILLINVDSKWNLALRRLYNYHVKQGDVVEMRDLNLSAYPHKKRVTVDASNFDRVYVSNLFERNAYNVEVQNCSHVEYGGIGSRNPAAQLPAVVELCEPYYAPGEKISYGFITRGCIRNCWFCKVPKYEGSLRGYNYLDSIVRGVPGEIVKFLDNNILAYSKHMEVFKWLIANNIRCTFNQGLDFRLVTDENLQALAALNYEGEYIFAFDDPKYQKLLDRKILQIKKYIPNPWKIKFYIYYHPEMDLEELIGRVEWCRSHECLPYIMRDAACWGSENEKFLTDYAAYCNQPGLFKKLTFEDFLQLRHKGYPKRLEQTLNILNNRKEAKHGDETRHNTQPCRGEQSQD